MGKIRAALCDYRMKDSKLDHICLTDCVVFCGWVVSGDEDAQLSEMKEDLVGDSYMVLVLLEIASKLEREREKRMQKR